MPGREQPSNGADTLPYLARENVSYLAPIGNGLMLAAGRFRTFRTYESFYAR